MQHFFAVSNSRAKVRFVLQSFGMLLAPFERRVTFAYDLRNFEDKALMDLDDRLGILHRSSGSFSRYLVTIIIPVIYRCLLFAGTIVHSRSVDPQKNR